MISKEYFNKICDGIFCELAQSEYLIVNLLSEDSQFIRFNTSKIRQTGFVFDSLITLKLIKGTEGSARQGDDSLQLSGSYDSDLSEAKLILSGLRKSVAGLPVDPYIKIPENNGESSKINTGKLLDQKEVIGKIFSKIEGKNITGIYTSGPVACANANSLGQKHWFYNDNFIFDYSFFLESGKMHSGVLAGMSWDQEKFIQEINDAEKKLEYLRRPVKKIKRGNYKTYLSPDCVCELISVFGYGGVSEAAIRQGGSPLIKLKNGEKTLSSKFSLSEDFTTGLVPMFNSNGEVAPAVLPLIENGELRNTLICSRTAKEYGLTSNAAYIHETPRAISVGIGDLSRADILSALGTGLYLSNLHYLNWSDRQGGRITGMTRYACFWVENGEIIAPIEDLRFDDSIYNLFGANLLGVTDFQNIIPDTGSYEFRNVGGAKVPGMLLSDMAFTL